MARVARKQDRDNLTNKPTTIYLPSEDREWLEKRAEELTDIGPQIHTVTSILRELVREYRNKHERRK